MTDYITISATQVKQPMGEFFIASMKAEDVVRVSFADIRTLEDRDIEKHLGIQRELKPARVKEIKEYLKNPDATFPTSVILAIDEKCVEYNDGVLTLYPHNAVDADDESLETGKIAKIIDGQHRIAAFLNKQDQYENPCGQDFEFNVAIFVGIDVSEQASIFATVNLAQTKVNKSLVYDLEALSKARSPHKTCHLIAVALDADKESPLSGRIKRLGVATKGRLYEPLTQAVVVETLVSLIAPKPFEDRRQLLKGKSPEKADAQTLLKYPFRNMFIDEKDEEIYRVMFNYFTAVSERWGDAWANPTRAGNVLAKANAYRALMRYLRDVYLSIVGSEIGTVPTKDQFLDKLRDVKIDSDDFTKRNFVPGGGGQTKFYQLLTNKITKEDLFAD